MASPDCFADTARVVALDRLGETGDHEIAGREAKWPGGATGHYYVSTYSGPFGARSGTRSLHGVQEMAESLRVSRQ